MFFQLTQLKQAIPTKWKTRISNYIDAKDKNQNHHVFTGARIWSTHELSAKEVYLILISIIVNKPISISKKLLENTTLDWSKTYLLLRLATIDTTFCSFQYKTLNNVLFLNKNYTLQEQRILFFAHFVRLWKKLAYISFMTAFMLNLFGKHYGHYKHYPAITYTTGCHSWTN